MTETKETWRRRSNNWVLSEVLPVTEKALHGLIRPQDVLEGNDIS